MLDEGPETIAVRLKIDGHVHGVSFRAGMAGVAHANGVSGWARNMADGSVDALLEGERDAVLRVVDWANRGPPAARVEKVEMTRVRTTRPRGFKIMG